jgi:8-oxo-dGTP diphosphatase
MIRVVCALLVSEGRVLLAQRPEGKHLSLKWEFPGGKVEPGESPEQALRREIDEELGTQVEIAAALPISYHTYERGEVEMIPFVCNIASGSQAPQPNEHAALVWALPEEIASYDLAPADWPILEHYLAYAR